MGYKIEFGGPKDPKDVMRTLVKAAEGLGLVDEVKQTAPDGEYVRMFIYMVYQRTTGPMGGERVRPEEVYSWEITPIGHDGRRTGWKGQVYGLEINPDRSPLKILRYWWTRIRASGKKPPSEHEIGYEICKHLQKI